MSEAFGPAALRLAGMAGAALGWAPEVFWGATPAELAAVVAAIAGGTDRTEPPDAELLARLKEAFPDG